ncbi:replication initiation protein [Flavobacterium degerlachei]|jgi:plasmid replication initiation protein|uniref:Initiator Replication protein n=1 Tax=Flavobacterium degerlachei TaxID=229203 RepID=A0A1H3GTE4_9FLAO|nr:replication initiation protein [Flavobacterium degerlachei]SDY05619.1 Initiator Replication protein [Flavobacterium degerlachei]
MREITIAQDNRLTASRYELNLIEKRVFYYIIKEVRDKYTIGQRDLFDDLILKIPISKLCKDTNQENAQTDVRKGLKSLRMRSFEYLNDTEDRWLEVGFINYSEIIKGIAEIQVSRKLMPFLVELSTEFTPYSLNVAMSLKSKWSQRMYELCQKWHGTDGFRIRVDDLRNSFCLNDKYKMYASLNEKVLQVAKRELKALYDIGQCDVYFEFSEERNGRTVETLRFKLFRKNSMNVKTTQDMLLELIPIFKNLYNIEKMPKNDAFINNVIIKLQRNPNLIEPLNKRIREIISAGIKDDTARYIRYILNEDILSYVDVVAKTEIAPKKASKSINSNTSDDNPQQNILNKISKIAKSKTV